MRALVIDFASAVPRCGLASADAVRWIELEPNPEDARGRLLYQALERLAPEEGWRALDALACVTGPGPMTGVRVGIAATIGLARGASLPVVPLTAWHLRVDPSIRDEQEVRFPIGRAGWSWALVDTGAPGWPIRASRVDRAADEETPLRDDALIAALQTVARIDAADLRPVYLRPASVDPQFDVFGRPLAGAAT